MSALSKYARGTKRLFNGIISTRDTKDSATLFNCTQDLSSLEMFEAFKTPPLLQEYVDSAQATISSSLRALVSS